MSNIQSVSSIGFITSPISGNLPPTRNLDNSSLPDLFWAKGNQPISLLVIAEARDSSGNPVNQDTHDYISNQIFSNPTGNYYNWEYRTQSNSTWTGILMPLGPTNKGNISLIYDTVYPDTYNEYRCTVSINDPSGINNVSPIVSNAHRIYRKPNGSAITIGGKYNIVSYNHSIDVDYTELYPSDLQNISRILDYSTKTVLVQGIYLSQYPNQFSKSEFAPLSIEEAQLVASDWDTKGPGYYHYRANSVVTPGTRPRLDNSANPNKTFRFSKGTESRPQRKYIIDSIHSLPFNIYFPAHMVADSVVPSGGAVTSTITAATSSGDYVVYTSNHSFASGSFVNVSGLSSGWNTSDMTNLNSIWVAESGNGYFSVFNFSDVSGSLVAVSGIANLRTVLSSSSGNFGFGLQIRESGDPLDSDDPNSYWSIYNWEQEITTVSSIINIADPNSPSIPIRSINNIDNVKTISITDSNNSIRIWKDGYSLSTLDYLNYGDAYTVISTGNLPFTLSYPPPESGDYHLQSCVDSGLYYVMDPDNLIIYGEGVYYLETTEATGCYTVTNPSGTLSNGLGDITSATLQYDCETCGF